jgi:hypothetical protein
MTAARVLATRPRSCVTVTARTLVPTIGTAASATTAVLVKPVAIKAPVSARIPISLNAKAGAQITARIGKIVANVESLAHAERTARMELAYVTTLTGPNATASVQTTLETSGTVASVVISVTKIIRNAEMEYAFPSASMGKPDAALGVLI